MFFFFNYFVNAYKAQLVQAITIYLIILADIDS